MRLKLIATASFGLEAVVKREIQNLGYEIEHTENGHIAFWGDERAIVRSNLWLRCADRVLLCMAEFRAETFEELFQQTKGIAWEEWILPDGKFTVTGSSVRSQLHSVPACQSIVKKAIAERLGESYGMEILPETGAEHAVKVSLLKDAVTLTLDTSGTALHKRGYRAVPVRAPLKETMAAALVSLTFWRKGRILVDPCCGSGTIAIEAAMIERNIAPGLSRHFVSEQWEWIPKELWAEERKAAYAAIDYEADLSIFAGDIDRKALVAAEENAEAAGVEDCITFLAGSAGRSLSVASEEGGASEFGGGVIITNLPYAKRIGDEEGNRRLYRELKNFLRAHEDWSLFTITPDRGFEKAIGRCADRRRKLYNGNIETTYYQIHGKKKA